MKTFETRRNPSTIRTAVLNPRPFIVWIGGIFCLLLVTCLTIIGYYYDWFGNVQDWITAEFFLFILAGFIAQMIDGALGMAYGVSASSFLLSLGVSPAAASASIHTSEIFTSGVSGLMHLRFQNVNKKLFQTLLLPGMLGAMAGAYVLYELNEYNHILRPLVAGYTLLLGVIIVLKAVRKATAKINTNRIPLLASFGGLMDSIGGGGWGPIVSSTLIAGGRNARYTVGSVNLAEFFVALASSLTFIVFIGLSHFQIIAGLIIGGMVAAPIAASITRKLPTKAMMIMVGVTVIVVSLRLILISF